MTSCAKLADDAGLGRDLVLQSAFGDSGHTTFFIKSAADFRKHESEIVGHGEIKIMKRINCRGSAIEACSTKHGTIVGPLMTELVGFPELTPYRGGWCGNEIFANAFAPRVREAGPGIHGEVWQPAAQGKVSRVLRAGLPDRPEDPRPLPRRAEPAYHRRQLHDQPRRLCPRRRAVVPVPPARVLRHSLLSRHRGTEPALGRLRAISIRGAS